MLKLSLQYENRTIIFICILIQRAVSGEIDGPVYGNEVALEAARWRFLRDVGELSSFGFRGLWMGIWHNFHIASLSDPGGGGCRDKSPPAPDPTGRQFKLAPLPPRENCYRSYNKENRRKTKSFWHVYDAILTLLNAKFRACGAAIPRSFLYSLRFGPCGGIVKKDRGSFYHRSLGPRLDPAHSLNLVSLYLKQ